MIILGRNMHTLSVQEAWLLEQLEVIPEIDAVRTLATGFQEIIRHRQSDRLDA